MDKYQALRRYFGHGAFREGQEALVDALLAGRDALGIMPTGGGKSLCYQVPALLLPGGDAGDLAPHLPDEGPGDGTGEGGRPGGVSQQLPFRCGAAGGL